MERNNTREKTQKEGEKFFEGTDHKAGLAILTLVIVQAMAGYFWPGFLKAAEAAGGAGAAGSGGWGSGGAGAAGSGAAGAAAGALPPTKEDKEELSLDSLPHQRASYASGDFDAKYIPGIEVPIPRIARFQFTILSSCGIPNSPSVNFELVLRGILNN
jgi:hypothetical protein